MADVGHEAPPPEIGDLYGVQTSEPGDMETLGYDDGPDPEDIADEPEPIDDEPEEVDTGDSDEPEAPSDASGDSEPQPEPATSTAPEWLPDGYDWQEMAPEQKLLIQHVYDKGAGAGPKLTAEQQRVLDAYEQAAQQPETTTQTPTKPQHAEFKLDPLEVPEDYKDDPGINALINQVNARQARTEEYTNAVIGELWKQHQMVEQLSSGQQNISVQAEWNQFVARHPEVQDQKTYDALTQKLELIDPNLPAARRWEAALEFATGGQAPPPDADRQQAADIQRGRRIQQAQAVNTASARRTTGRTESSDAEVDGLGFVATFMKERSAGALPSQRT